MTRKSLSAWLIMFATSAAVSVFVAPVSAQPSPPPPAECVSFTVTNDRCAARIRQLEAELAANKSRATMSSLGSVNFADVCAILAEVKVPSLSADRARARAALASRCATNHPLTEQEKVTLISDTQRVLLGLSGRMADGWLKSDQFARVVCKGVEGPGDTPVSDRYAGWMFAAGIGLPRDDSMALFLLRRAKDYLRKQAESDEQNATTYTRVANRIDRSIDAILANGDPALATDTRDLTGRIATACSATLGEVTRSAGGRLSTVLPDSIIFSGLVNPVEPTGDALLGAPVPAAIPTPSKEEPETH